MASCTNPIILYVIYSFVGQCILLCKVKMLLYISLNPFVKRNVSYFHCSFIVLLYYTVAYYNEELVKNKNVAKPQVSEGHETEGSVRHLIQKKIYIYTYIYTYIHYIMKGAICPLLFLSEKSSCYFGGFFFV
jgi:hypothetical protein